MHGVTRTVLVTGASSGIGRATALRLLDKGHSVIGTARDLRRMAYDHPNFSPFQLDLSDLDTLSDTMAGLGKQFPALDAVVLCAGRGRFGSLEEFSLAQIRSLIDLNFTAQACLVRVLLPGLKRMQGSDVVFVGSEAGLRGSRKGSIYCAGKFALRGFAQALREECGRSGVRVSLVNPGMVKTAFFDDLDFAPGADESNYLPPEDIAEAVCFVLGLPAGSVVDEINLSPLNRVIRFKPKQ